MGGKKELKSKLYTTKIQKPNTYLAIEICLTFRNKSFIPSFSEILSESKYVALMKVFDETLFTCKFCSYYTRDFNTHLVCAYEKTDRIIHWIAESIVLASNTLRSDCVNIVIDEDNISMIRCTNLYPVKLEQEYSCLGFLQYLTSASHFE